MPVRGSAPDPLSYRHHPPTQYSHGPSRTEANAFSHASKLQAVILSDSLGNRAIPHSLTIRQETGGTLIGVCLRLAGHPMSLRHIAECAAIRQCAAICCSLQRHLYITFVERSRPPVTRRAYCKNGHIFSIAQVVYAICWFFNAKTLNRAYCPHCHQRSSQSN
jgi:hypothetical protein